MSARIMTSLLRRAVLLQIETMAQRFSCRRATAADADAIAAVFSSSFRLLTLLPMLHTAEENRQFIETVLKRDEVSVAESADRIASFLGRDGEEIGLLCWSCGASRPTRGRAGSTNGTASVRYA